MPFRLCSRCRRRLDQEPCVQCEIRPRERGAYCIECKTAATMLSRYWQEKGMPLSWSSKPRHKHLGKAAFWRVEAA